MAQRPYTGWDGDARSRRAGTEKMIDIIEYLSGGGLWNNGSWGPRPMRGKRKPSVHGTGRACDLSWRGGKYGGYGNHAKAKVWVDFLTDHATELQLEAIFDYYPRPHGTGYLCSRDYTIQYPKHTFSGAPGGDWIHLEVSPKVADDPAFFDRMFTKLIGALTTDADIPPVDAKDEEALDTAGPDQYPGHLVDVDHEHQHEVKAIQSEIGVKVDGRFGPKTLAAVQGFQGDNDLPDDVGGVDEATWVAMFGNPSAPKPEYPGTVLKVGSTGQSVKVVQAQIDAFVDGEFGPKTETAVKGWQTAQQLVADGLVGPKTWKAMFG